MLLSLKIAFRYLFSKKSHTAINAISMVSVCGVAVATMAMICTLSVYNGFEEIISMLYSEIDPQIEVRAKEGKTLQTTAPEIEKLYTLSVVDAVTPVIEDNALALYGNNQKPVLVKGVPENYPLVSGIDMALIDGEAQFADTIPYAVIGVGVSNDLMVAPYFETPIKLYTPKRKSKVNLVNPLSSFNSHNVYCSAVFSISQPEYDENVIYVPISVAQHLFDYTTEATVVEVKLKEGVAIEDAKSQVADILGAEYVVKDRKEQKADAYSMMAIEKWITFLMLAFVLVIAAFNIIASVAMLMIDKHKNIKTLHNLGATNDFISKIFFNQGVLISAIGAVVGIALGLILSLLQQHIGILKMSSDFIVDSYPVKVIFSDLLIVMAVVAVVGIITAGYPVKYISSKLLETNK